MIDEKESKSNSISKSNSDIITTSDNKTNSDKDPPTIIRFIGGNKGKIIILVHSTGKTIW